MRQTVAHHVVWGEAYRRLAERAGWRAAFLDPNALATLDAMYRTHNLLLTE